MGWLPHNRFVTERWRLVTAFVLFLGLASLFIPWGREVERLSSGSADFVAEKDAPFRFMRGKEPMRLAGVVGWDGWTSYKLRAKFEEVDRLADKELMALGFKADPNQD